MPPTTAPTNIRYQVILVTTMSSLLLYLDRNCMAEIAKGDGFLTGLGASRQDVGDVLSKFYLAYALAQLPAGWLSDRFGARGMMTIYILLWSLFTALTGLANSLIILGIARIGCGIAQAGAYPASGGLLSRWAPFAARARASATVTFGGRLGGAVAPWLTAALVAGLAGWRPVLVLYGIAGIGVAWAFWHVFRERPEVHPRCNEDECHLIASGRPPGVTNPQGRVSRLPIGALLRSKGLWLMCLSQWGTNIGWSFLVTWMPTYLKEVQHLDPISGGRAATLVLALGMIGMPLGGWVTDVATRRLGIRWGRALPLALSRFTAAGAYFFCLAYDAPYAAIAALAIVSFSTDLGLSASWAYMQDVGGKHVGSVLAWPNMWGNLGASMTAGLIPRLLKDLDPSHYWQGAFLICAGGFIISGLAALGINATVPVVKEDESSGAKS